MVTLTNAIRELKKEIPDLSSTHGRSCVYGRYASVRNCSRPSHAVSHPSHCKGWPDTKDDLPLELRRYFDVRDELTAQDGVVFKGLRYVIPTSLRPKIHERLHGAHSGIESCLRRARETVYWHLVSGNGPPFNSYEFQHFAESYDMEHVTCSPHYPQSNGKVENSIKTAKNLLKKSKAARSDICLALLEWRNTPSEGLVSSPAQRMFGRRTRTLIPTTSQLLKPKIVEDVPENSSKENSCKQSTTILVLRKSHPFVVEMLCVLNLLIDLVDGARHV